MWYQYYNGTSVGIPFNTRAPETIKEAKYVYREGKKLLLNKEEGHRCSEMVTVVVFLWNYGGTSLEFDSIPESQHLTAQTQALHNSTAKPWTALWKLSIPSEFQGDLRMSWHHCTFETLGISHLILSTKILYGKLMWEFPDYICSLIWLICHHFLEMY